MDRHRESPPGSRRARRISGFLLVGTAVAVYRIFDPVQTAWMLRFPTRQWFGLSCPLCGAQRAAHAALHGQWQLAWTYNRLLPPVLVWCALVWCAQYHAATRSWHERFTSLLAWIVYAVLLLVWFVVRNLLGC